MEDNKLVIYKKNDLIEDFIFNATEMELQILNYTVAITHPRWEGSHLIYELDVPELVRVFKTNSKSAYKEYRLALKRLMKREYSYRDERGTIQTENLVIRVGRYEGNDSWLEFKFNEYISQRICNLKGLFTKYDIKHIAMFKSRYAFMMYEYFKMKLGLSLAKTFQRSMGVVDLKEKLGLSGKYDVFRDFERGVLMPMQDNINKHSDITMNYTVTRKGRTPTHIKFTAQYKKNREPENPIVDLQQQTEIEHLGSSPEPKKETIPLTDTQKRENRAKLHEAAGNHKKAEKIRAGAL